MLASEVTSPATAKAPLPISLAAAFAWSSMARDDGDLGASPREDARYALADAFRSAGDDDGTAFERLGHDFNLQMRRGQRDTVSP